MVRKGIAAVIATALAAALGAAPASALRDAPAFPLAPGQIAVALGPSPGQWQPQAGPPLALTLLAGPPRGDGGAARRLTAFAAVQPGSRPCAASARSDQGALLAFPDFYGPGRAVTAGSALASTAEARYAASADAGVLSGRAPVRTCVWLARSAAARARPASELLPLLNGLFAAAVWPTQGGYAFDAAAVGVPFAYSITSNVCGLKRTESAGRGASADGIAGTVSVGSLDCPGDAWRFSFSAAGGSPFGLIDYTDAESLVRPAAYGHLGGCDLTGVQGLSVASARRYVAAIGCRVANVLRSSAGASVGEAEVDGGDAALAPAGTAVDLVADGG